MGCPSIYNDEEYTDKWPQQKLGVKYHISLGGCAIFQRDGSKTRDPNSSRPTNTFICGWWFYCVKPGMFHPLGADVQHTDHTHHEMCLFTPAEMMNTVTRSWGTTWIDDPPLWNTVSATTRHTQPYPVNLMVEKQKKNGNPSSRWQNKHDIPSEEVYITDSKLQNYTKLLHSLSSERRRSWRRSSQSTEVSTSHLGSVYCCVDQNWQKPTTKKNTPVPKDQLKPLNPRSSSRNFKLESKEGVQNLPWQHPPPKPIPCLRVNCCAITTTLADSLHQAQWIISWL